MDSDHEILLNGINQLKQGNTLIKQKANGKFYSRRFFLDRTQQFITYDQVRKSKTPRIYQIDDFDEIRVGFQSSTFEQLLNNQRIRSTDEDRAFSIYYNNHQSEVHLLAPDQEVRDRWVKILEFLKSSHEQKGQIEITRDENWIMKYFRMADKNHSKTLSKNECEDLLAKSFNFVIPKKLFNSLFTRADRSAEGFLSQEEFLEFFRLLTRRDDLYELMKSYSKNANHLAMDEIFLDHHELITFLERQGKLKSNNHRNDARAVIEKYELNATFRERGRLTLDGFRNLLLSPEFDVMSYQASNQIYQDMTLPLCHYYINTSHNTYLFNGQLTGESNPEAYNRALLTGCRAVEFDCYDGDDGEPIVKHGFTMVEPCSFQSIIRRIEPNLFKTSPYPVIFNIENHCSSKQQQQMARILRTILGDRLMTSRARNHKTSALPSPEDLKYKVLVRSKPKKHKSDGDDDDDDDGDDDEFFIYLENVSYRDLEYARSHYSPYHSSSLVEGDFLDLAKSESNEIIAQTTWRILRTYPGGLRQDSSNPNPVYSWNCGVQMAALNYQTNDNMMALCYGKFRDNGGCGYVQKPDYLIKGFEKPFDVNNPRVSVDKSMVLTITVISGQFLMRDSEKSSDIPDPYVNISVHGLSCDEISKKTEVVQNNGFNPRWNEKLIFLIRFPEMALIYFKVYDYDAMSDDERIGIFCLPATLIQPGYRHIHLRSKTNDILYSTLFVHIEIEESNETTDDDQILRERF